MLPHLVAFCSGMIGPLVALAFVRRARLPLWPPGLILSAVAFELGVGLAFGRPVPASVTAGILAGIALALYLDHRT